jgi:hypothetical protein
MEPDGLQRVGSRLKRFTGEAIVCVGKDCVCTAPNAAATVFTNHPDNVVKRLVRYAIIKKCSNWNPIRFQ